MTEIDITRGFLLTFLILSLAIIQVLKALESRSGDIWQWRAMAGFLVLALIIDWSTR